jgi:hypothetical protein
MQLRATGGLATVLVLAALAGCAGLSGGGWTTLVDGTRGMDNFKAVGDANWSATDGAIQASKGSGNSYLVSKQSYRDFEMRVEFWSSDDANSGVFLRCQEPANITDENCYEANIFDQRPDPTHGTGAIVKVAAVAQPMPKAGGKWNVYEISAQGDRLVLVLNGQKTVDVRNGKLAQGPFALQWGRGVIKFRKVEIRAL